MIIKYLDHVPNCSISLNFYFGSFGSKGKPCLCIQFSDYSMFQSQHVSSKVHSALLY